jgi:hypothetical protein
MDLIKGVLSEELENSERILKRYRQELDALPKGSLVAKKIRGGVYYYLASREAGKVHFYYQGKLSAAEVSRLENAKKLRAKYRGQISKVRKQIVFLQRALHERKRGQARPGGSRSRGAQAPR